MKSYHGSLGGGLSMLVQREHDEPRAGDREVGADDVVNYREMPDWHVPVRELTGGKGVDQIIEVGGPGTLERSLRSAAANCQINLIGWLASNGATFDPKALAAGIYTIRRIALGSRAQFEAMNRAIATHKIRPVIARVFAFDEAPAAFEFFMESNPVGKVVIAHA